SVPLMLDPVLSTERIEYPSRADVADIYEQIYQDLEMAYNLLNGKTVDASNPEYYASSAAAAALFSRVALYNEDYDRVISETHDALVLIFVKFMYLGSYIIVLRQMKCLDSLFEVYFYLGDHPDSVNESLSATFSSLQTLLSTSFS